MNDKALARYTDGYNKIAADFKERNIPTDKPGFCDHYAFLEAESNDPNFLNNYAAFVISQQYSTSYLQRAREIINKVSLILYKELDANGRLGACVDISAILSRMLDCEGVWNCGIKGSLTISFPQFSNEEKTYFWSVDHGDFVAAHAWLYAPPYQIVDLAILHQPYSGNKKKYLPHYILSDSNSKAMVEDNDIVNPDIIERSIRKGGSNYLDLKRFLSQLKEFNVVFPGLKVDTNTGASLKYCPVAIHATSTPFEEMHNMDFRGKSPYELYVKLIKGIF